MKQSVGEKNIAWFKLAECVARGEKERALNLHRLLTHSFQDQAFIKKLEAEIVSVFNTQEATTPFLDAAHLYYNQTHYEEALFIYQTLHASAPTKPEYVEKIVHIAAHLADVQKEVRYKGILFDLWMEKNNYQKAYDVLVSYQKKEVTFAVVEQFVQWVLAVVVLKLDYQKTLEHAITTILEKYKQYGLEQEKESFIQALSQKNLLWAEYARSCK